MLRSPAHRLSGLLLVAAALLGWSTSTEAGNKARRRGAANGAQAARARLPRPDLSLAPLAARKEQNQRLIAQLKGKREEATAQAEREVSGWSDTQLAAQGWRPDQRARAIEARAHQLISRHDVRQLASAEIIGGLLEREASAPLEKQLHMQHIAVELERSALMNRMLGSERYLIPQVKHFLQVRFRRLARWLPNLRRETQLQPGTVASNVGAEASDAEPDTLDPIDSTMWKRPKRARTTPRALFAGPWMKAKDSPELPATDTVLELKDFRSLDADGFHPSVFTTDEATGIEWKVKFVEREDGVSPEPSASRLLYALGYHTEPVYRPAQLKMDPRAVLAAFAHANRLGFRIREGNPLRLKPGKYGFSPYKLRDHITSVTLRDGTVLDSNDGVQLLERGGKEPALLDGVAFVTVHEVTVGLKGRGGTSIGPFHPDDAPHIDRREMRALSVIASLWMNGFDTRFNNLRLDAEVDAEGEVEIVHKVSDAGGNLTSSPEMPFDWSVDLEAGGERLHNDRNAFTLRAFDRTTLSDARWAVRQIGRLSEQQILASVAGGATSWPAVVLYTEKLIARRDDLIVKFGLEAELDLLRPDGPRKDLAVSGAGKINLRKDNGKKQVVRIPEGGFVVRDGVLVAK